MTQGTGHTKITVRRGDIFNPVPPPDLVHGTALQTVTLAQQQTEIQATGQATLAIERGVSTTDGGRISRVQA